MSRLDLCATIPMRGRDSHAEKIGKSKRKDIAKIETPEMPFDTPPVHIRRGIPPVRPATTIETSRGGRNDGSYAMRFTGSTWGHSEGPAKDRPTTRDDVKNLAFKYEKNLGMVAGYKGVELAQRLQTCNDLLLEELIVQLRVLNLGQAELLERNRESFAQTFTILENDAAAARKANAELKTRTLRAEDDAARMITEAKARIVDAEVQCARKVEEVNANLETRQREYDEQMKRYLEQKSQLENHVKSLHHVFLDFQNDAVYLTLENLKNQLSSANTQVDEKTEETSKLQMAIQSWKQQHKRMEENQAQLEEVVKVLRTNLSDAQEKNRQLQRQIDMLKIKLANMGEEESDNELDLGDPTKMTNQDPEANEKVNFGEKKKKRRSVRSRSIDAGQQAPWVTVHQKLEQVEGRMNEFIEQVTNEPMTSNDQVSDRNEMMLVSSDFETTRKIIESRVDQLLMVAEILTRLDPGEGRKAEVSNMPKMPRFVQFFHAGITGQIRQADKEAKINLFQDMRSIMQAKYLSDKWNRRTGRQLMRLPEFVVMFYMQTDDQITTALYRCSKLWRLCRKAKDTEVRLFRKFLKEKYTLDELTFFLEMRHGLLGLPIVREREICCLKVSFSLCKELMDRILGGFSPIASMVTDSTEKLLDQSGNIDYAVFLEVFLKFYSNERVKRKTAVQLMMNSTKYTSDVGAPVLLEMFPAMMQSLGYRGSIDQVLEFYRLARLFSGGEITLEGIYRTMDDMNIHFYSLDIPTEIDQSLDRSETTRHMIVTHWAKFGQWFEGLRRSAPLMDNWVKANVALRVRRVDQAFQMNQPVSVIYAEYRAVLDAFQFFLGLLSRGAQIPMQLDQSEKQLEYLEKLNEHLLAFVISAGSKRGR